MTPTDSSQCTDESRQLLGAVYSAAAEGLQEAVEEGTCTIEGEEATEQEVWDYMLDRAEECPLAWCILLWASFQEALQALQEAPGDRSLPTMTAAIPVVETLCCVTHATQYARLLPEFLMQLGTMSTAERRIHEEYIIFQRTKAGDSVYTDLSVEMTNFTVRHYGGHFVVGSTANFHAFLDRVALDMPSLQGGSTSRARAEAGVQGASGDVKKYRHHKFGQPFQQVYSLLARSVILRGPPRPP